MPPLGRRWAVRLSRIPVLKGTTLIREPSRIAKHRSLANIFVTLRLSTELEPLINVQTLVPK